MGLQLIDMILQLLTTFCEDTTSAVRQLSAKELGSALAALERWAFGGIKDLLKIYYKLSKRDRVTTK